MTFTQRIVTGSTDAMSAVIGIILLSGYCFFREKRTRAEVAFMILLGLGIMDGICESMACLVPGYAWMMIPGYLANDLMPLTYTYYLMFKIREREAISSRLLYIAVPASIGAVVVHFMSVLNSNLLTAVENGFPVFGQSSSEGIMIAFIIIIDLAALVQHRRSLGTQRCLLFACIAILPMVVPYAMSFFSGSHVRLSIIMLTLLTLYVRVHVLDMHRMADQEKELTRSRMDLMISQIRPHFLYNALSVIYYLCERDPETAQQAVGDFTAFLRNNLDAMEHEQQRPFSRELEVLKSYLSLESLRYGKRLSVEYDIGAKDFMIPALSVQPLVENAVKHGIAPKKGGGTVRIRSGETETGYVVEVEDDGVGYNPVTRSKEEHTGIGLKNVAERLSITCGGTLTVRRLSGEGGTLARIVLPKTGNGQMRQHETQEGKEE